MTTLDDLHRAEAALREGLAALDRADDSGSQDDWLSAVADVQNASRAILAALDAARGQAVSTLTEVLETLDRLHHDHMRAGDYYGEGCYHTDQDAIEIPAEYAAVRAIIEKGFGLSAAQPAAVPEGMVLVQRADLEALSESGYGKRWGHKVAIAARRIDALLAAAQAERAKGD